MSRHFSHRFLGLALAVLALSCTGDHDRRMPTDVAVAASTVSANAILVVSDEASCGALPIATTWTSDECTLNENLTFASDGGLQIEDVRVTVPGGVTLTNDGGSITVVFGGLLRIRGTLTNTGGGTIDNSGFWDVRDGGTITIAAGSTVETGNQLHVTQGTLTNEGTLTNTQSMSIGNIAAVVNVGTLNNSGYITVDGGLSNVGTLNNTGTIELGCSPGFTNTGTMTGNPPTVSYCWVGGHGTLWSTAANWNTNSLPTADGPIVIRSTSGPTLDIAFTLTGVLEMQLSTLVIGASATLTNEGRILLGMGGQVPGSTVIQNEGTLINNATLNNNDLLVNHGTATNNATIEPAGVVGVVENSGLFVNAAGAYIRGGLRGESGGEFRNLGEVDLNRTTNSNSGLVTNQSGATLSVNNALANDAGGRIENDGIINITHALNFPGRIDNAAGATIVNRAQLVITDADAALNNEGLVENSGTIENGGIVQNDGVICGSGTVSGNAVLGNAPRASCNSAPTADAGPDQNVVGTATGAEVTLDGSGSSDPDGDALSYGWTEGTDEIATGVSPTVNLPLGNHVIVLTVSDGELDDTDEVVIDINATPEANAGPDQTVECTGDGCAEVTLDGSGSSDPDGDTLTYSWKVNGSEFSTAVSPTATLPLGTTIVTLTVSDGVLEDTDQVEITVEDTQAPTLEIDVDVTELWPPNHKMFTVASGLSASDVCDDSPTLSVTVTSNEPVNALGDGDTDPDWEVLENDDGTFDVLVRAERSGTGTGRMYTITVQAADVSGKFTEATFEVAVPHSKTKGT